MTPMTPEEEEDIRRRANAATMSPATAVPTPPTSQPPGLALLDIPRPPPDAFAQSQAANDARALPSDAPVSSPPDVSTATPTPSEPAALPTPTIAPPAPVRAAGVGGTASADAKSMKELAGVTAEQRAAAEQIGKANAGTAGAKADAATALATQQAESKAERSAALIAAQAEEKRLNAKAEAEDAKYKSMGFRDFFSNATIAGKPAGETAARIFGALSVALGAAGASLTGGANGAQQIIDKTIDREYQRQKDEILKQKDVVSEARGLAASAKAEKLVALEGWRKAAYDATLAQGNAMVAKMGPAGAEAEKAGVLAGISEKAMESEQAQKKGNAMIANTKADTALKGAEIGKVKAETELVGAKTTAAADPVAKLMGQHAGRAQGKMMDNAMMTAQLQDDFEQNGGAILSEKAAARLQANTVNLRAAEHDTSRAGAWLTNFGRDKGLLPSSATQGLTEREQKIATVQKLAAKKAGTLISKSAAKDEIEANSDQFDPTLPGLTDGERRRRLGQIRTINYVGAALSGQYGPLALQAAQKMKQEGATPDQWVGLGATLAKQSGAGDPSAAPTSAPSASDASKPTRIRLRDGRTASLGPDNQYHAD